MNHEFNYHALNLLELKKLFTTSNDAFNYTFIHLNIIYELFIKR